MIFTLDYNERGILEDRQDKRCVKVEKLANEKEPAFFEVNLDGLTFVKAVGVNNVIDNNAGTCN